MVAICFHLQQVLLHPALSSSIQHKNYQQKVKKVMNEFGKIELNKLTIILRGILEW